MRGEFVKDTGVEANGGVVTFNTHTPIGYPRSEVRRALKFTIDAV